MPTTVARTWRSVLGAALLRPAARPLIWLLLAAPAMWLWTAAILDMLGPNPAEALIRGLGDWTLRLLCLTLAVTPLREWTGVAALARTRRWFGVATFLYGTLHWLSYVWFDQGFDVAAVLADIPKRPFILVGTAAWLMMLPLAATSFNRAIKALGARRWQMLHKAIYGIVLLALLHFFWMRAGKHDFAEVAVYATIVAVLLGWRVARRWRPGARTALQTTRDTVKR